MSFEISEDARAAARLFGSADGKMVLQRLIRQHVGVMASNDVDALALARQAGARDVVLGLVRLTNIGQKGAKGGDITAVLVDAIMEEEAES
jgi:transcription antitermination factor NusA-like protein